MENGSVVSNGDGEGHHDQDGEKMIRVFRERGSSINGPGGHKRSLSGSILSKLSFLRLNQGDDEHLPSHPPRDEMDESPVAQRNYDGDLTTPVQQQKKPRRRKGSLRKTALLGTGRLRNEVRERRGSTLEQVKSLYDIHQDEPPIDQGANVRGMQSGTQKSFDGSSDLGPKSLHQNGHVYSPKQESWAVEHQSFVSAVTKPMPVYTSTTDDDDLITFPRASSSVTSIPPVKKPSSSGSDSYFPTQSGLTQRRRSSHKPKSPLRTLTNEATAPLEDWDYADTEWWGWVVLVVTWLVFVVGMGSCFGVWSWAWDVGETPYAPPELEDDPTLPIVGYYPALMILTAVMAWVWVVVAWIGMKYFKHAKISGEDV